MLTRRRLFAISSGFPFTFFSRPRTERTYIENKLGTPLFSATKSSGAFSPGGFSINSGRTWFVNNALARNGDGKSWLSAWNALGCILWRNLAPGDSILISGGKDGQNYYETLTIGASGQPNAPITITSATDANHAGPVTIDANRVRATCLMINGQNHVVIQSLILRNTANDCNLSVRNAGAGVVVQGITSDSGMGPGNGGTARCFDIRNCIASTPGTYAVVLQNCIAITPAATTSQTDALWCSGNDGVLVQGNTLAVDNIDATGHSDSIQSYMDINVTFRNNLLTHPNGGRNNHGLIVTDIQAGGIVDFYNNVVLMGPLTEGRDPMPEAAIWRGYLTTACTGRARFWNNTIYGGYAGYYVGSTAGIVPADEFRNNIVYMLENSTSAYFFQAGNLLPRTNTDTNLIYSVPGGRTVPVAYIEGVGYQDWAGWTALGYDARGRYADPLFVDAPAGDFHLRSGSPAINAGMVLPIITTDRDGTVRPRATYTIGAYEG